MCQGCFLCQWGTGGQSRLLPGISDLQLCQSLPIAEPGPSPGCFFPCCSLLLSQAVLEEEQAGAGVLVLCSLHTSALGSWLCSGCVLSLPCSQLSPAAVGTQGVLAPRSHPALSEDVSFSPGSKVAEGLWSQGLGAEQGAVLALGGSCLCCSAELPRAGPSGGLRFPSPFVATETRIQSGLSPCPDSQCRAAKWLFLWSFCISELCCSKLCWDTFPSVQRLSPGGRIQPMGAGWLPALVALGKEEQGGSCDVGSLRWQFPISGQFITCWSRDSREEPSVGALTSPS